MDSSKVTAHEYATAMRLEQNAYLKIVTMNDFFIKEMRKILQLPGKKSLQSSVCWAKILALKTPVILVVFVL